MKKLFLLLLFVTGPSFGASEYDVKLLTSASFRDEDFYGQQYKYDDKVTIGEINNFTGTLVSGTGSDSNSTVYYNWTWVATIRKADVDSSEYVTSFTDFGTFTTGTLMGCTTFQVGCQIRSFPNTITTKSLEVLAQTHGRLYVSGSLYLQASTSPATSAFTTSEPRPVAAYVQALQSACSTSVTSLDLDMSHMVDGTLRAPQNETINVSCTKPTNIKLSLSRANTENTAQLDIKGGRVDVSPFYNGNKVGVNDILNIQSAPITIKAEHIFPYTQSGTFSESLILSVNIQ